MSLIFRKISKKTISAILALAVVLCSITCAIGAFADNVNLITASGNTHKITWGSPAIPAFTGKIVDFSTAEVQFEKNGEYYPASSITWSLADGITTNEFVVIDNERDTLRTLKPGIVKLTAKLDENTSTPVYLVIKDKSVNEDYTFYLVDENVRTGQTITSTEWVKHGTSYYLTSGTAFGYNTLYYNDTFPSATVGAITTANGLGGNDNADNAARALMYNSDVLKDFADYTVNFKMKYYTTNANVAAPIFTIVTRSTLNESEFSSTGQNMFKAGTTQLGIRLTAVGGINPHLINDTSNTKIETADYDPGSFHTVDNEKLVTDETTDVSYVLSANKTSSVTFDNNNEEKDREISLKLSGNKIFYKLDGKEIFNSEKTVHSIKTNVYNGSSFASVTGYEHDNSTYLSNFNNSYNTIMDGSGKGTVGFLFERTAFELLELKVALNDVSEETMLPYYDLVQITWESPAIPAFTGKIVDFSKAEVQLEKNGEYYSAADLTWTLADGASLVCDEVAIDNINNIFKTYKAGKIALKATADDGKFATVYIIIKEKAENEDYKFYLVDEDVRSSNLTAESYNNWVYHSAVTTNNYRFHVSTDFTSAKLATSANISTTNGIGLNVASAQSSVLMYNSEILNNFADYTVNFKMYYGNNNSEVTRNTFSIIARSALNSNSFNSTGQNLFDTTTGQLALRIMPIGGIHPYIMNTVAYSNPIQTGYYGSGNHQLALHTLDNYELVTDKTSDASYVLSANKASSVSFDDKNHDKPREISLKLSGNNLVYKIDDNEIFNSAKDINTLKLYLYGGSEFASNGNYQLISKDADSASNFKNVMQHSGKGTVGFMVYGAEFELLELKVALNDVSEETMLPYTDLPKTVQITWGSPAIPAFSNKLVDFSNAEVQFEKNGEYYPASSITWSLADGITTTNEFVVIDNERDTLRTLKPGIVKLTAKLDENTSTPVYLVIKNKNGDNNDYVFNLVDENVRTGQDVNLNNWVYHSKISPTASGNKARKLYTSTDFTKAILATNAQKTTNGLGLPDNGDNQSSALMYNSDVLRDFADYTVNFKIKFPGDATNLAQPTLSIITRSSLNANDFSSNGQNLFDTTKGQLAFRVMSVGGIHPYIMNTVAYDTAMPSGYYGVGNHQMSIHTATPSTLITGDTTNPGYILSPYKAENTLFDADLGADRDREISIKLSGNDLVYTLDNNEVFNSGKEIQTVRTWLYDGSQFTQTGDYQHNSSDDSSAVTNFQSVMNNSGKGTVGIMACRSDFELLELKVALNDVSEETMLPYKDYDVADMPANSGLYTTYIPKLSATDWIVDEAASTAKYYVNDGGYITVVNNGDALGKLVFNGTDTVSGEEITFEINITATTAESEAVNSISADVIADSRVVITEPENGYFAFTVPQSLNLIPGTVDLFVNEVNTPIESTLTTVKDTSLTYKAAIDDISAVRFEAQFEESAEKLLGIVYNYNIQYKEESTAADTGIRFQTAIPAVRAEADGAVASNDNITEIGAVIIPTALLGDGGLSGTRIKWDTAKADGTIQIDGVNNTTAKYIKFQYAANTYTYHTIFNAMLKGLNEQAKQYDISCITYIKYNDNTYTYSDVAASSFNAVKNTDIMLTATTYSDSLPGVFDDSNVVLTFPVFSDIHVEAGDNIIQSRYASAISSMTVLSQNKAIDLVCIAGDLTSATPSGGNVSYWEALERSEPQLKAIKDAIVGQSVVDGGDAAFKAKTAEIAPYYRSYERQKLLDVLLAGVGTSRDDDNLSMVLSNAPKTLYCLGNHDLQKNYVEFLNANGEVDANGMVDGHNLEYIASLMGESVTQYITIGEGKIKDYTDSTTSKNFIANYKNNGSTEEVLYNYFFGSDTDKEALENLGNRHMVVKGFNFLSVNEPEDYKDNFAWLKEKLAELTKKSPNAPIFLLNHYLPPMNYGGMNYTTLDEILKDYPQVIVFGGHAHNYNNLDNTFMQSESGYYAFEAGSLRYLSASNIGLSEAVNDTESNIKNRNAAALLVEVDSNGNIRVSRVNALTGDRVGNNVIIPAANSNGSRELLYTENRKNSDVAPSFSTNIASAVYKLEGDNIQVIFPKALSPNTVIRYELTVKNEKTDEVSATKIASSLFYNNNTWNYSESEYTVNLTNLGLEISSKGIYTVKIVAVDNWENSSRAITTRLYFDDSPYYPAFNSNQISTLMYGGTDHELDSDPNTTAISYGLNENITFSVKAAGSYTMSYTLQKDDPDNNLCSGETVAAGVTEWYGTDYTYVDGAAATYEGDTLTVTTQRKTPGTVRLDVSFYGEDKATPVETVTITALAGASEIKQPIEYGTNGLNADTLAAKTEAEFTEWKTAWDANNTEVLVAAVHAGLETWLTSEKVKGDEFTAQIGGVTVFKLKVAQVNSAYVNYYFWIATDMSVGIASNDNNGLFADINYNTRPSTGYIAIPKSGTAAGIYANYKSYGTFLPKSASFGINGNNISISMCSHGTNPTDSDNGITTARDTSVANCGSKDAIVYMGDRNSDTPEDMYYYGILRRDYTALQFAKNLTMWDGSNITVSGGSMGGWQAVSMAALDSDVNKADVSVTWMCQIGFADKNYVASTFMPKYTEASHIFSTVTAARIINKNRKNREESGKNFDFRISDAGLADYTAPPAGIMALYNEFTSDYVSSYIRFNQYYGHGNSFQGDLNFSAVMQKAATK